MASGSQGPKQSKGYFVALTSIPVTQQFSNSLSGGAGGSFVPGVMTHSDSLTSTIAANTLLKDKGKTVVSSTHTWRKVQAVIPSGPAFLSTGTNYPNGRPFYVELVTAQNTQTTAPALAYLPGLM